VGQSGMTPGGFKLVFQGEADVRYVIEASADLASWGAVGSVTATEAVTQFVDGSTH